MQTPLFHMKVTRGDSYSDPNHKYLEMQLSSVSKQIPKLHTTMAGFVTAFMNPLNYVGGVSFTPETDIPDLSGKVILVTGGTLNPD